MCVNVVRRKRRKKEEEEEEEKRGTKKLCTSIIKLSRCVNSLNRSIKNHKRK